MHDYPFFKSKLWYIWIEKLKILSNQSGHVEKPFAGHMWSAKGFQHNHFFFLSILKNLVKSQSGHAEKPLWFDKFFDL